MPKTRYVLGLALVMAAFLYLLPALQAAHGPVADSPEVSELLSQAKTHAIRLRNDADQMHHFSLSRMSWESHATQISMIKDHINNLGKVLQKMRDNYESASPWQKQAIDRITPLAQELATNTETTIEHINKNQSRLHTPEYKSYLKTNADLSESLSSLISDYVSYGKNKARFEKLGTSLEAPSM